MKKHVKELSIGERIKEIFDKGDMNITQFAQLLNCDRANIYNIFRRKKIDIVLLLEISKILNHNFIEEICTKHGLSNDIPSSQISIVLEINNMDTKTIGELFKTIKRLEVKTIQKTNN